MKQTNGTINRDLAESKGNLGVASLYFYLGYYSGMRYSVNHLRSLNPTPIEELHEFRLLIEQLPPEVAAIRFGADPEPAMVNIGQLISGRTSSKKTIGFFTS